MKRFFVSILAGGVMLVPGLGMGAVNALGWAGLTRDYADMDPHGAAGPKGILSVCNNGVVYYTKTGSTNWSVTPESDFFLPTICCDAKALYDPTSQRFFLIAQESSANGSALHVAVSTSSNPASGTTNDWKRYRFPTGSFFDYPGMGLDSQALYATYQVGNAWMVLNKADLISGHIQANTFRRVTPSGNSFFSQGWQAATVIGNTSPGDVAYSVAYSSNTNITLYAMTNVLNNPVVFFTNLPCPLIQSATHEMAPQKGTTNRLIDAVGVPMGNAFWRDGNLWFCGSVSSSNQPERSVIRYYRITTGGFPNGQASLAEWGDLDGGSNTWRQHSAIAGNARGDVCIVFTQTSSNSFPTIYAAVRKAGQTAFDTVFVKASLTNDVNGSRWADYCVASPDPEDQTFWVSHLFVNQPNGNDFIGTWWANITRDSLYYVDNSASGPEVGTRAEPFHAVRNAQTATSGAKTFVISPGNYSESPLPLLINKNVRLENPYPSGIVHIGP